jgi:alpha-D-ribose 1-methylphosphonate 5-triphosphate synthase subunit PhnH
MSTTSAASGFADPVDDAQAVFRCILQAMSRPAEPVALPRSCRPPRPLSPGVAALALTLLDGSTSVWLHGDLACDAVRSYLQLRTGVALADDPARADFALIGGSASLPRLDGFDWGGSFEPHGSTTVVLTVPSFTTGPAVRLSGPGIESTATLAVGGLDDGFWRQWDANAAAFPRGVDVLLSDGAGVCGLPRTVRRLDVLDS